MDHHGSGVLGGGSAKPVVNASSRVNVKKIRLGSAAHDIVEVEDDDIVEVKSEALEAEEFVVKARKRTMPAMPLLPSEPVPKAKLAKLDKNFNGGLGEDVPPPKTESIAIKEDPENEDLNLEAPDETPKEIKAKITRETAELSIVLSDEAFDASTHCSVEAIQTYKYMAIIGLKEISQDEQTCLGKPIVWSHSDASEINSQFDDITCLQRSLFGLSNRQMYYDPEFYKRQYGGTSVVSYQKSFKVKYNVQRKLASKTDDELHELLKGKQISEAAKTFDGKISLDLPRTEELYSLHISSEISLGNVQALMVLTWDETSGLLFGRLVRLNEEDRDKLSLDIHTAMLDAWSIGQPIKRAKKGYFPLKAHIPHTDYIYSNFAKLIHPMETYNAIHLFLRNDENRSLRDSFKQEKQCGVCKEMLPFTTPHDHTSFMHHQNKHIIESHSCNCENYPSDFQGKLRHIKLNHIDGYRECPDCKAVVLERRVQQHKKQCPGPDGPSRYSANMANPAICSYCGRKFQNNYVLNNHVRNQHQEYDCKHCGEKFEGKDALVPHLRDVHNATVTCDRCNRHLMDQQSLATHQRACKGPRQAPDPPRNRTHLCVGRSSNR